MVRAAMAAVQGGRAGRQRRRRAGGVSGSWWWRPSAGQCGLSATSSPARSSGSPVRPGGSGPVCGSWKPRSRSYGCAFSFCWQAWFAEHPAQPAPAEPAPTAPRGPRRGQSTGHQDEQVRGRSVVAAHPAPGARLADPRGRARTLLAGVVDQGPALPATAAARRRPCRPAAAPLPATVVNKPPLGDPVTVEAVLAYRRV
jgi:hypothetical protein